MLQTKKISADDESVYLIDSFPITLAKYNYAYTAKVAPELASKSYTHDTSKCKVSKANCDNILGIKLKLSHSKLTFYNEVDWCKLPCPAGRKLDTQHCVTIIEK